MDIEWEIVLWLSGAIVVALVLLGACIAFHLGNVMGFKEGYAEATDKWAPKQPIKPSPLNSRPPVGHMNKPEPPKGSIRSEGGKQKMY